MNSSINIIPYENLVLAFIPVILVIFLIYRWNLGHGHYLYAMSRMLLQLLLIGYFLSYIFGADSSLIVLGVLTVMLIASAWIALGTVMEKMRTLFVKALLSLLAGGGLVLLLITQGVLDLQPWYRPSYFIPLAGMIFANAMNSLSLAAERMGAEMGRGEVYVKARNIAFKSSLIPITNSLFAVGLVSLPGMMTGQILSGVSPLIAARYQIMVMCMIFGASGISSALFLAIAGEDFEKKINSETV